MDRLSCLSPCLNLDFGDYRITMIKIIEVIV
jgi:hypothetical protein